MHISNCIDRAMKRHNIGSVSRLFLEYVVCSSEPVHLDLVEDLRELVDTESHYGGDSQQSQGGSTRMTLQSFSAIGVNLFYETYVDPR
jgi:hypothetical protein